MLLSGSLNPAPVKGKHEINGARAKSVLAEDTCAGPKPTTSAADDLRRILRSSGQNFQRRGTHEMLGTPSRPRAFFRLAFIVFFCLLISTAARAQTEITAGLRGTVSAEGSGVPLAGARVLLNNESLRVRREATTDESGA